MRVDRTALRTNQGFIVSFTVLGFILGDDLGRWIVLGTGLVLALGTLAPSLALFQQFYHRVLKPAGILHPHVVAEDPAPHRFAQGIGAGFLLVAAAFLFAGLPIAGWAFSWIVTALASINLAVNFCAGCFLYFQLGKLGLLPARSSG